MRFFSISTLVLFTSLSSSCAEPRMGKEAAQDHGKKICSEALARIQKFNKSLGVDMEETPKTSPRIKISEEDGEYRIPGWYGSLSWGRTYRFKYHSNNRTPVFFNWKPQDFFDPDNSTFDTYRREEAIAIINRFAAEVLNVSEEYGHDIIRAQIQNLRYSGKIDEAQKAWRSEIVRLSSQGFPYQYDVVIVVLSKKFGVLEYNISEEVEKFAPINFEPAPKEIAFKAAMKEARITLKKAAVMRHLSKGDIDEERHSEIELAIVRPNKLREHRTLGEANAYKRKLGRKGRLAWIVGFNWLHPDEEKRQPWDHSLQVWLDAKTLEYLGGDFIY